MEKIIDMVRSEKPIERIRSLEQKIDEVDKIEAIESCVELLKDHIWAVKEVLTTAEASAYLGLSESYLYKLTSSKRIPHTTSLTASWCISTGGSCANGR